MDDPVISKAPLGSIWQFPDWFHHHGIKPRLTEFDAEKKSATISANATKLTVNPISFKLTGRHWLVAWEVRLAALEKAGGSVVLSDEELLRAFSRAEMPTPSHSRWLIEKYGGHAAHQGHYIRWGSFLNIPGPGTSHDGDPNISIELDEEMSKKILSLLD